MTAHVLISGTLYRAPEQRFSKAGKPYVTATIRAKDGDGSAWWKVLSFSESACAELMRLGDGDAVSAQGSLKVETYEKDGQTRVSMTVIADAVLALKLAPKAKRPKETKAPASPPPPPAPDRSRLDRYSGDGRDEFGDQIPF